MIILGDDAKKQLIDLASDKNIYLEGNICKLIDANGDLQFSTYLQQSISKDRENRKKRLQITKTIQDQNKELLEWKSNNEKLNNDLQSALSASEKAKQLAESDLDVLQKKTQKEL